MGKQILMQFIIQYFYILIASKVVIHHHTIHIYPKNRYRLEIDNFNHIKYLRPD